MPKLMLLADAPTVDYSGIMTSLGTACSGILSGAQTAVTTALPYALGVAGIFIVISIGYKLIKRFAK